MKKSSSRTIKDKGLSRTCRRGGARNLPDRKPVDNNARTIKIDDKDDSIFIILQLKIIDLILNILFRKREVN
ncbi:hypothetical protein CYJ99_01350 [Neisseria perflava]|jgi:hypothetical protein|nr:hypothetical protein HMPREF3139_09480 [Neisseria sp. HMSC15G01]PLA51068.1 hypothetical protein CYJ99_01350 [Neisseria perflava]